MRSAGMTGMGRNSSGPGKRFWPLFPPHSEPITCSADGNPAICSDPNRNIHGTPDGWEGSASGGAVGPGKAWSEFGD